MILLSVTIGDFELAKDVAEWIEIAAIAVISIGVVLAFASAIHRGLNDSWGDGFSLFKQQIARGLLLGLDLLIAADIIKTVTLEPTLENVAALGLLVFIRTFLSWSLVLEIEGRWPWQRAPSDS